MFAGYPIPARSMVVAGVRNPSINFSAPRREDAEEVKQEMPLAQSAIRN
jgi:hypothetical protein